MKAARPYPIVTITPKGERAIVDGHPWDYEGEVVSVSGTSWMRFKLRICGAIITDV